MNLKIENARGQRYYGASAITGTKSGVATQLKLLNGKFLADGPVIRNLKDF